MSSLASSNLDQFASKILELLGGMWSEVQKCMQVTSTSTKKDFPLTVANDVRIRSPN